jgi:low affinity Fe/Cu permease
VSTDIKSRAEERLNLERDSHDLVTAIEHSDESAQFEIVEMLAFIADTLIEQNSSLDKIHEYLSRNHL